MSWKGRRIMDVMKELEQVMRRRAKVAAAGSELRRETNRANALRSTGPRTSEGKARSSGNATKYGLYSDRALLPGEDRAEYDTFRAGMYARLKPFDELERLLADRAVIAAWKLRRVQGAEASRVRQLRAEYAEWHGDKNASLREAAELISESDAVFERYAKWEAAQERSVYRALHELRRVQADRRAGEDEEPEPVAGSAPAEPPAPPQEVNERNEPNPDPVGPVQSTDPALNNANCSNEANSAPSPSPGTPGEGRGEGDFGCRTSPDEPESPSS